MDWMFHMMQITDCFFRARRHSKWILNVDIDERLVMTQIPLSSYLRTIPEDMGDINFSTKRVQRTEHLPSTFTPAGFEREVLFSKYQKTAPMSYIEMKVLLRPDRTEGLFYHWVWARYPGFRTMMIPKTVGYVRHYRTTLPSLAANWVESKLVTDNTRSNRLDVRFEERLMAAVVRRLKRVYELRDIWCEEIPLRMLGLMDRYNYNCVWKGNEVVEIDKVRPQDPLDYKPCKVEPWNNVTLEEISFKELRADWRNKLLARWNNFKNARLRPISAFVYEQEIVVVTAKYIDADKPLYCRYFDCNRIELPGSAFQSTMFPYSAVYCARRAGAKYMTVTRTVDEPVNFTVHIVSRLFDEPVYEVSVCVGPIYGAESRWLEIVETTEHHILMGIQHFYFTVFHQVNAYTRRLLDDYEQTGHAEVTVIQTEYKHMDWMFHMMQITDCFFRARRHSKWILNVDIDERLVMTQMPLLSYLRSLPQNIADITFSTKRVARTERLPPVYKPTGIKNEILFTKYKKTVPLSYVELKGMLRPDKTEGLFYHWVWTHYPGYRSLTASKTVGYVRHYRTTLPSLRADWVDNEHVSGNMRNNRLDREFEEQLVTAVIRRLKRVYELRDIWCEEIPLFMLGLMERHNYNCVWKVNGTRFN
uniref:Glycosyltransferase family 92 protein n=1 Tax=Caenorhabditis japonica TaxID=281687 RepID=A0A8R1HKG8_CAEJA